MSYNKEIIIVGGGVIGLSCAHYLAASGARVTIIERDKIGDGASHGNCGLLCFDDIIPLCSLGTVSHEIARTLKKTSPLYIKPELDIKRLKWLLKFALKCNASHMNQAARAKYEILNYSISQFDALTALEGMDCDYEKRGRLSVFRDRKNFEKYESTASFLHTYNMGAALSR